jgi:hypothetical protein
MSKLKLIPVDVFYNNSYRACANGGPTEKYETLYIEHEMGWWDRENVPEDQILKLVVRDTSFGVMVHLEPIVDKPEGRNGYMDGGSFVYSGNSRFRQLISKQPMSVHDRTEAYQPLR